MARTNQVQKANIPHTLPAGDATEKKIEGDENRNTSMNQAGEHLPVSTFSIPLSVAKDLQSPEARDRYRALDHWEAKDSKAPLDPVFEAIEDDDPAVRAKATAIVERYWDAEQERQERQNNGAGGEKGGAASNR